MKVVRDLTWPQCRGCRHRVLVPLEDEEDWEEAFVCELGMDILERASRCPRYVRKAR
jgi:hypothetical protein